jgi:hypothetical protein
VGFAANKAKRPQRQALQSCSVQGGRRGLPWAGVVRRMKVRRQPARRLDAAGSRWVARARQVRRAWQRKPGPYVVHQVLPLTGYIVVKERPGFVALPAEEQL